MENSRLSQLQRFLEESPNDAFLRYAMAVEYVGMGNDPKAKEVFEQLLVAQPDYSATYYHLGKLYERLGQRDAAAETYRKGIGLTRQKKEQHALAELMAALNELEMEE